MITRRDKKGREYSVEDKKRYDVVTAVKYIYDDASGTLESRVHCNGRFLERHVFEFDADATTAKRYTIYPDGSREPIPTMTFSYDPSDKQYKHWRFVDDGDGNLKDMIMLPDTHQFRQEYSEYDSHGNPTVVRRLQAISRFGTVDFEPYGDELLRREYFEN